MKVVQISPRGKSSLYNILVKREAAIRAGGRGTFVRSGRKTARAAPAQRRPVQPAAERIRRIEVECPLEGREGRLPVGLVATLPEQGFAGAPEQEPSGGIAGREVEGLARHLRRRAGIALGEAGLGIGVAAVGEEITGGKLA